ncbi:MAG: hypothetical protein V1753_07350 [Pseudomonadota bacterium]
MKHHLKRLRFKLLVLDAAREVYLERYHETGDRRLLDEYYKLLHWHITYRWTRGC